MKIALDYDGTFTADRVMWSKFVRDARDREDHSVTFVTSRHDGPGNDDIESDARDLRVLVVYCGGRQKASCYTADIWIDDMPELIPSLDALRAMTLGCERMGDTTP